MIKYDRLLTMYRVACHYYEDNMSQSEIARIEGTSRSQISHLLIEARKLGMVQINIVMPEIPFAEELTESLHRILGIRKVCVVDTKVSKLSPENEDELIKDVSSGAASLLSSLLEESRIIGIGRGRMMYNISLYLPPVNEKNDKMFVPLAGDSGNYFIPLQITSIVNRFATQSKGNGFYLNTSVVDMEDMPPFQREEIAQLNRYWDDMDTVIFGMGNCDDSLKIYGDRNILPLEFMSADEYLKAKGDILGQPFSEKGAMVWKGEKKSRYSHIGFPLERLPFIKNSICIACGESKIDPLITAAKLGYYNTLITDILTAKRICELYDS